jgi:hypothetical protein
MGRYIYSPLAQGPTHIRLLRVLPGADDDEIKCEIFHYTLRAERASALYEALSYVWGPESNEPCRIFLRNTDDEQYWYLDVRPNLLAALRRLRDPDLPRILWIDAICMCDAHANKCERHADRPLLQASTKTILRSALCRCNPCLESTLTQLA